MKCEFPLQIWTQRTKSQMMKGLNYHGGCWIDRKYRNLNVEGFFKFEPNWIIDSDAPIAGWEAVYSNNTSLAYK